MIDAVLRRLSTLFSKILVVTKDPDVFSFLKVRVVADDTPTFHPLAGLVKGLVSLETEYAFVCAGDSPLIHPHLVKALWAARMAQEAVIPRWKGSLQPLCAVYSKKCVTKARLLLDEGRGVRELATIVRTRIFEENDVSLWDPEGVSFWDVDTPADLEKMKKNLTRASVRV
jgi:molybdopterin-guanine dinucleotide biosynthesis protein A